LAAVVATLVVRPERTRDQEVEMTTITTIAERLAEIGRQIDRLQGRATAAADDAKPRVQHHLDALRQEEASARAAIRDASDEMEDKLAQLEARLDIAEQALASDVAEDRAAFATAVDAELHRWDAYVERLQMKAAARTGEARELAEADISDLRERRIAIGERLAQVWASSGEAWREQKARVVAAREELERKADELSAKLR
jgi:hypothetical protein